MVVYCYSYGCLLLFFFLCIVILMVVYCYSSGYVLLFLWLCIVILMDHKIWLCIVILMDHKIWLCIVILMDHKIWLCIVILMVVCPISATGNKSDKVGHREIPLYVADEFAQRHEMKFIETSAKEAENVDKLFYDIAKELIRQTKDNEIQPHYEEEVVVGASTPVSLFSSCCSRLS